MKEYVKIDISLYERLLFLFSSLINKKYIISNNIEQNKIKNVVINDDVTDCIQKHLTSSSLSEVDIPFFELDETNVESNL